MSRIQKWARNVKEPPKTICIAKIAYFIIAWTPWPVDLPTAKATETTHEKSLVSRISLGVLIGRIFFNLRNKGSKMEKINKGNHSLTTFIGVSVAEWLAIRRHRIQSPPSSLTDSWISRFSQSSNPSSHLQIANWFKKYWAHSSDGKETPCIELTGLMRAIWTVIGLQYPASRYSLYFSGEQEKRRIAGSCG